MVVSPVKESVQDAPSSAIVQEYSPENQRQVLQALETLKDQLNFSFQEDLRQELQRFTWFNMRFGC